MKQEPTPQALLHRLETALPPQVYTWLQQASDIAAAHGVPIYLVGGPVRDLLLGNPILDLDLVLEGNALPVAEAFATATAGKLTKHPAFRTAMVKLLHDHTSFPIDFVTARKEIYPQPAALPVVEPSHMRDDLFRRDFTMNALALRLDDGGALLDPYGGLDDLQQQVVRVLHDRSFVDDPTRILRAVRFAARLGFAIEPYTRDLIVAALDDVMIGRTSPQRILNEIWLLLDEPQPEAALRLLHDLGALPQLGFAWNDAWPDQFARLRSLNLEANLHRAVAFGLLVWPLNQAQRSASTARYNLPSAERKLLHTLPDNIPPALAEPQLDPVALDDLLRPYDLATLHTLQLVAPPAAAANIAQYIDDVRPVTPLLTGDDLRALGLPPGPRYKQLLEALRREQLRGTITTVDEARAWITRQVADDMA